MKSEFFIIEEFIELWNLLMYISTRLACIHRFHVILKNSAPLLVVTKCLIVQDCIYLKSTSVSNYIDLKVIKT
jgi:hypothetical protein